MNVSSTAIRHFVKRVLDSLDDGTGDYETALSHDPALREFDAAREELANADALRRVTQRLAHDAVPQERAHRYREAYRAELHGRRAAVKLRTLAARQHRHETITALRSRCRRPTLRCARSIAVRTRTPKRATAATAGPDPDPDPERSDAPPRIGGAS